jgi:hypothetical protein
MKKVVLFILLFASVFSTNAQVWHHAFGWIDAREFNVQPDSSTDNTTALRALAARANINGAHVIFPMGNIVITDSIIWGNKVVLEGSGGSAISGNEETNPYNIFQWAGTNIIQRGNNKSVFVFNPGDTIAATNYLVFGMGVKNMNIVYQNATPPTYAVGIEVVNGGGFEIAGTTVQGFFFDVDIQAAGYATIHDSWFGQYARSGLRINNINKDVGGIMINNCAFLSGNYTSPFAGLEWLGSGATRITNCEFNLGVFGNGTYYPKYCAYFRDGGHISNRTQELYINNCSFSAFDSSALVMLLSPSFSDVFLSNLFAYGPLDSIQYAPFIIGSDSIPSYIGTITIDDIAATGYTPAKVGTGTIPVLSTSYVTNTKIGSVARGTYFTVPYTFVNPTSSVTVPLEDIVSSGDLGADGSIMDFHFTSLRSAYIDANFGVTNYGAGSIIFRNGNVINGGTTSDNQWWLGSSGIISIGGYHTVLSVEHDSAARESEWMTNATSTGAAIKGVTNGALYGYMIQTGSSYAGAEGANYFGLEAYNDLNIYANGTGGGTQGSIILKSASTNILTYQWNGDLTVNLSHGAGTAYVDIAGPGTAAAPLRVRVSSAEPSSYLDGYIVNRPGHLYYYDSSTSTKYDLLQAGAGFANPMLAAGDLIDGGSGGTPQRLAAAAHAGMKLTSGAAGAISWVDSTAGGGGGGTPIGGSIAIQYDSSGSFGGIYKFQYNSAIGLPYDEIDALTTTTSQANGFYLTNATASTSGSTKQNSPSFTLRGGAWSGSADSSLFFQIQEIAGTYSSGFGTSFLSIQPIVAAHSYNPVTINMFGQMQIGNAAGGAYTRNFEVYDPTNPQIRIGDGTDYFDMRGYVGAGSIPTLSFQTNSGSPIFDLRNASLTDASATVQGSGAAASDLVLQHNANGTLEMAQLLATFGLFGGTSGTSGGRSWSVFDYPNSAERLGVGPTGTLYVGSSSTAYTLSVAQQTSTAANNIQDNITANGTFSIGAGSISNVFNINKAPNITSDPAGLGFLLSSGTGTTNVKDAFSAANATKTLEAFSSFGRDSVGTSGNSGVTYTTAATVYIQDAPVSVNSSAGNPNGVAVTITNAYSLYVAAGTAAFLGTNTQVVHLIGSGSAPTTTGLGSNVSSATLTGNDNDFKIVVITSGAVSGTICTINPAVNWASTPIVVFSLQDATTAGACTAMWGGGTSSSNYTFGGTISGAGTYTFNFHVHN